MDDRDCDTISVDSIISLLLSMVEPSETEYPNLAWNLTPKDLRNDKQDMLFDEKLYISQLHDTKCKLNQENKDFGVHELREVGHYVLNIEESYDGYVIFSHSQMLKGKYMCGHNLKGKYDDKFVLVCEKRTEYNYVDNVRVEKYLEARTKADEIEATRETRINRETDRSRAIINIKDREDIFLLDGGILALMRYIVLHKLKGDFEYYSMNLFGRIMRCVLEVSEKPRTVKLFYQTFSDAICIRNTQFFNNVPQDISETYYTPTGRMILHYWKGYQYLIHSTRSPPKPKECILPKMELMWKCDNLLFKRYQTMKNLTYTHAMSYLNEHPDIIDFLHDYIIALLKFKPDSVLEYTVKFFQNMKHEY